MFENTVHHHEPDDVVPILFTLFRRPERAGVRALLAGCVPYGAPCANIFQANTSGLVSVHTLMPHHTEGELIGSFCFGNVSVVLCWSFLFCFVLFSCIQCNIAVRFVHTRYGAAAIHICHVRPVRLNKLLVLSSVCFAISD